MTLVEKHYPFCAEIQKQGVAYNSGSIKQGIEKIRYWHNYSLCKV